MNATPNPEVAADKARERYPKGNGQFEALTFDIAFPEARALLPRRPWLRPARPMTAPP